MIPAPILLVLAVLCVSGCGSHTEIPGGRYTLEKFYENGRYYLRKGRDSSPGGVFDGYILKIGANREVVIAQVHRLSRGDPDGWYILDIKSGQVAGPLDKAALDSALHKHRIECIPPDTFAE
jgi:hypothetical protein